MAVAQCLAGAGGRRLGTRPGWGRSPKLTDAQAARVLGWLGRSPCEFGFATDPRTTPRVAAVIEGRLGVRMNHRYLNDWLARRGITPQVPERAIRDRLQQVKHDQQGLRTFFGSRILAVERSDNDFLTLK